MPTIEELIEYHNECEYLDFKQEDYKATNKHNLIKDVMVLANADTLVDRYIIVGVKKENGAVEVHDVTQNYDSANIQEYIYENIEPELNVTYEPFFYNERKLLIITIKTPNNAPYMIKKNVTAKGGAIVLQRGDFWVRKGSRAVKGVRDDFDRMYNRTIIVNEFDGKVEVEFQNTKMEDTLLYSTELELPSFKLKKQIEALIRIRKKYPLVLPIEVENLLIVEGFDFKYRRTGFDNHNLKSLEKFYVNLDAVGYTSEEDLFYMYEECTNDMNFWIGNYAKKFLKNVTFELKFPRIDGLIISNKRYKDPYSKKNDLVDFDKGNYPSVSIEPNIYSVFGEISIVPHNLRTKGLPSPLRIGVLKSLVGQTIPVEAYVHAENLPSPIKKILSIIIA
jgi:hypothetical protein